MAAGAGASRILAGQLAGLVRSCAPGVLRWPAGRVCRAAQSTWRSRTPPA